MTSEQKVVGEVSPQEADGLRDGALFLDVRTPAEYREAHLAGSVLQPLTGGLDAGAVRGMAEGKTACVVVCGSGKRAAEAASRLAAAGLDGVRVLKGGLQAWEAAGLPLVRGPQAVSLERQVRIAAGALVLVGAVVGYFVHPAWIALSAFVGAGLVFAGLTDTCGMGLLLARMPWNCR
jgi:rhodanese-related sulfurtransferase